MSIAPAIALAILTTLCIILTVDLLVRGWRWVHSTYLGGPPLVKQAKPVLVTCPHCGFENPFWQINGRNQNVFGRKATGALEHGFTWVATRDYGTCIKCCTPIRIR